MRDKLATVGFLSTRQNSAQHGTMLGVSWRVLRAVRQLRPPRCSAGSCWLVGTAPAQPQLERDCIGRTLRHASTLLRPAPEQLTASTPARKPRLCFAHYELRYTATNRSLIHLRFHGLTPLVRGAQSPVAPL